MRNDFPSVIVERARYGRSRVHPKVTPIRLDCVDQVDSDDGIEHSGYGSGQSFSTATHQSMNAPWRHNRKEKRIHLAPLRRYLRAQVGRSWNDVYSDVCHTFQDVVSNGERLSDYVDWEVELNVRVRAEDGELITERGYGIGADTLFVHPESGILTLSPTRPRRRYKNKPRFEMVVVDNEQKLVKVDGLWFFVTLATIPGEEVTERPFDVVFKRAVFADDIKYSWGNEFYRNWGPGLYACHKRQANSREICRLVKSDSSDAGESSGRGVKTKFEVQCYRPQGRR